jgi:antitoxin VapB
MALSIKNDSIHERARALANLTGESVTTAVGVAIDERLERQQLKAKKQSRLEWLLEMTKDTSARMNDGRTSKEMLEELYDPETGLPV